MMTCQPRMRHKKKMQHISAYVAIRDCNKRVYFFEGFGVARWLFFILYWVAIRGFIGYSTNYCALKLLYCGGGVKSQYFFALKYYTQSKPKLFWVFFQLTTVGLKIILMMIIFFVDFFASKGVL